MSPKFCVFSKIFCSFWVSCYFSITQLTDQKQSTVILPANFVKLVVLLKDNAVSHYLVSHISMQFLFPLAEVVQTEERRNRNNLLGKYVVNLLKNVDNIIKTFLHYAVIGCCRYSNFLNDKDTKRWKTDVFWGRSTVPETNLLES